MRSTALPVSCIEDVAVDFLSHLPSFEFYGFQSLERGQLEIKTKYIYVYICASNWVGTDRRRLFVRKCVSIALLTRTCKRHGSPTRGQPGCIIRPAATFVHCAQRLL
jgi:hypothetical protein